ncbi:MAG TPA: methyltransferase domain-containing protein [Gemmatimonadaceae bacterium]
MQQLVQLGFPEMYERALVPPLFRPWAEEIVQHANVAPGDRVADVACGTGIVARLAWERAGRAAQVVGIDTNRDMLAVARIHGPDIEWREGDAAALPVEGGGSFDVVICQQGLQFFPHRAAAAAEMRRVLTSGGRLAVSVWRSDEEMPVLRELRAIAERRVGAIADRRHSFGDSEELEDLLVSAGFTDVHVTPTTRTIRFDDGPAFLHLNAMALVGMSSAAKDLSDEARSEAVKLIVSDSQSVLAAHTDAGCFAYEIGANVATARG